MSADATRTYAPVERQFYTTWGLMWRLGWQLGEHRYEVCIWRGDGSNAVYEAQIDFAREQARKAFDRIGGAA